MRFDREAFLLAVSALSGCERADPPTKQVVTTAPQPQDVPRPGTSGSLHAALTESPEAAPAPVPTPEPVTVPRPRPVADAAPHRAPTPTHTPSAARARKAAANRWFLGLSVEQRGSVTSACEDHFETACRRSLKMVFPRPAQAPDPDEAEEPAEDPIDKDLTDMSAEQRERASTYCTEVFTPPTCETPLVVAFDGQPIDFAASSSDRFAFVPGEPIATDWPTAATPWIALDRDGDGAITSGAELFGSSTLLASGDRARNGFAALAALDANGDGVLDARDPMFGRLVLWSDRNGDHRSTPDELRPLASVVTAIPLASTLDPRCNERDDCEGERGTLRYRDAAGAEHTGAVVDVYVRRR